MNVRLFDAGHVELSAGSTKILATTTGSIVAPSPDRPNQGKVSFQVSFGDQSGFSNLAACFTQRLERLLKGSHALSDEALCVIAGEEVWNLSVHVRVLSDDGNVYDLSAIAVILSLSTFRKIVEADEVAEDIIQEERLLELHHVPLPVTLSVFPEATLLDATATEEARQDCCGSVILNVNRQGELCGCEVLGGAGAGTGVTGMDLFETLLPAAREHSDSMQKMLGALLEKIEDDREGLRTKRRKRDSTTSVRGGFFDENRAFFEYDIGV